MKRVLTAALMARLATGAGMGVGSGFAATEVIPGASAWPSSSIAIIVAATTIGAAFITKLLKLAAVVAIVIVGAVIIDASSGGQLSEFLNLPGLTELLNKFIPTR